MPAALVNIVLVAATAWAATAAFAFSNLSPTSFNRTASAPTYYAAPPNRRAVGGPFISNSSRQKLSNSSRKKRSNSSRQKQEVEPCEFLSANMTGEWTMMTRGKAGPKVHIDVSPDLLAMTTTLMLGDHDGSYTYQTYKTWFGVWLSTGGQDYYDGEWANFVANWRRTMSRFHRVQWVERGGEVALFLHSCEGSHVVALTDHKPLPAAAAQTPTTVFDAADDEWSAIGDEKMGTYGEPLDDDVIMDVDSWERDLRRVA